MSSIEIESIYDASDGSGDNNTNPNSSNNNNNNSNDNSNDNNTTSDNTSGNNSNSDINKGNIKKTILPIKDVVSEEDIISDGKKIARNDIEEVNNILDSFYKYKSIYENNCSKERKKIFSNNALSKKDKKTKIKQLKYKCVSCKRNVNTIININKHALKMSCGDTAKPCKLNINIQRGQCENIETEIDNVTKTLESVKNDIVKNKTLFLYNLINEEDAIKKFNILEKEYNETNSLYYTLLDNLNMILNIDEKTQKIKNLEVDIYNNIELIKENLNKYKKTNNSQLLKDNIEILISAIMPTTTKINNEKYQCNTIESENINNEEFYHLNQQEIIIENLEYFFKDFKIIKSSI